MIETTQTLEIKSGGVVISERDFCDKRPGSVLGEKLARLAALSLPDNCTGTIEVSGPTGRVSMFAAGKEWGRVLATIVRHSSVASLQVFDGSAEIVLR